MTFMVKICALSALALFSFFGAFSIVAPSDAEAAQCYNSRDGRLRRCVSVTGWVCEFRPLYSSASAVITSALNTYPDQAGARPGTRCFR